MARSLLSLYELAIPSAKMYHGSPYSGIESFAGVKPPVFFTAERRVAHEYATREIPGAQRNLSGLVRGPTIYTVQVSGLQALDLRTAQHRELYTDFRKDFQEADGFDRSDFRRIDSEGFLHRGLPGFGFIGPLWYMVKKTGQDLDAIWADEGTQGVSLAVFTGLEKVTIISTESVT